MKNLLEIINDPKDYPTTDKGVAFLINLCEKYIESTKKTMFFLITTMTTLMIAMVAGQFALLLFDFSIKEHDITNHENLLLHYWESNKSESDTENFELAIDGRNQLITENQDNIELTSKIIGAIIFGYGIVILAIIIVYRRRIRTVRNELFTLSGSMIICYNQTEKSDC